MIHRGISPPPSGTEAGPPAALGPAEAHRSEVLARWVLGRPLEWALGGLCLLLVATWLPGYLAWPWWGDHDHFATVARAWDAGRLPYRDVLCNNFPGQIYAFWAVGKLFGWGHTAPFWALDAALLGILALALVAWSRQSFGRALPGLLGLAVALGHYFAQDYSQAGQRDWQGPLLALSGLLALQARPGRVSGRVPAVVLYSMALTIRPQVVLLAPAYALALLAERPRSIRAAAGTLAAWGLALAGSVALWFAPLLTAGVGPDILSGLDSTVHGAAYNKASPARVAWELVQELLQPRYGVTILLLGLAAWTRPARRWTVGVGLAALAGVLLYRPLSPLHHAYLAHPLALCGAAALAILAGLILESDLPRASWRLAAVLLVLGMGLPGWPRYSDPRNWRDLADRARGVEPSRGPPGYARNPDVPAAGIYPWEDYRQTLAYLRRLPPGVRVANALSSHAALNGPTGRLPVFPAESTVWLTLLRPEDEPRFAEALSEAEDAVVVWDPGAAGGATVAGFPKLHASVVRHYEPRARFGRIEVWARRPDGSGGATAQVADRSSPGRPSL